MAKLAASEAATFISHQVFSFITEQHITCMSLVIFLSTNMEKKDSNFELLCSDLIALLAPSSKLELTETQTAPVNNNKFI